MTDQSDTGGGFAWGRPLAIWLCLSFLLILGLSILDGAAYGWVIAILWSALCFAALVGLNDGASRAYIAASLEQPGVSRGYTISTRQRLEGLWTRYGNSAEGSRSLRTSFRKALTWKLYDAAMLVAVVYPTLVVVVWWVVTGHGARLGDSEILPDARFWPDRAISLFGMVGFAASIPLSWQAAASTNPRIQNMSRWLPVFGATLATAGVLSAFNALAAGLGLALGFVGGAAIAGAGSVVVVGAAAIVGSAAVAIATASKMMGTGLSPIAISIALVVTMAVALDTLDGQGRQRAARGLVTLALPLGWLATLLLIPWPEMGSRARGLFLFLAVFPLINAMFSVLSYAANLALARHGLLRGRILRNGLLGLVFGIAMSALLGLALSVTASVLDYLAGGDVFLLSVVFANIIVHPDQQLWLLLTVLTPIAPAALHAAIALLGATTLVPAIVRRGVATAVRFAGRAEGSGTMRAALTPFMLGTVWLLPFLMVWAAGWAAASVLARPLAQVLWTYVFAVRDITFALTVP